MTTKDFYYDLPPELIAQHPLKDRAGSRLLVLDKETGKIEHKNFRNIIEYLNPGDCLVMNNTRVIPARLYGVKEDRVSSSKEDRFKHLERYFKTRKKGKNRSKIRVWRRAVKG